ncbi:hypothetical protein [Burkholderia oklahomensis]|uniref:hypothetical protein n=1 Tax=Burkholderia oklahomensis TaxID=342113 RepID=UPI002FCA7809
MKMQDQDEQDGDPAQQVDAVVSSFLLHYFEFHAEAAAGSPRARRVRQARGRERGFRRPSFNRLRTGPPFPCDATQWAPRARSAEKNPSRKNKNDRFKLNIWVRNIPYVIVIANLMADYYNHSKARIQ